MGKLLPESPLDHGEDPIFELFDQGVKVLVAGVAATVRETLAGVQNPGPEFDSGEIRPGQVERAAVSGAGCHAQLTSGAEVTVGTLALTRANPPRVVLDGDIVRRVQKTE